MSRAGDVAALRCDIRVRPDHVTPQPVQPDCCLLVEFPEDLQTTRHRQAPPVERARSHQERPP